LKRSRCPWRQALECARPGCVPAIIECQLAADNQLLQEFLRAFGGQGDLERRHLAVVQVRAEVGSGVRGRLIAILRVPLELVADEMAELLFRGRAPSRVRQRRRYAVIDVALRRQPGDVRFRHGSVEARARNLLREAAPRAGHLQRPQIFE
jgi:hypothetical protein